ncbi:MAG: redoxin domain-containing protein [Bacteroidia bacterium]
MRISKMLLFLAALSITACTQKANDRFTIKGNVSGASGEMLRLIEFTLDDAVTIDSVAIAEDGSFSISSANTEPTVYMLALSNSGLIPVLVTNGDEVNINSSADQFIVAADIQGSAGTQALVNYFREFNVFQEKVAELNSNLMPYTNMPEFEAMKEEAQGQYQALQAFQRNYVKQFINEEKTSIVPVFAALYAANFLSPEEEFDWFMGLKERFERDYSESKYTQWFAQFVAPYESLALLQPGKPAPDFKLATPEGDSLALSDLRGKYVLVDFWASWCAPCRQENPNIVKMYERFKGKNFEILGVSLDRDRDGWVKAIKDDKLVWKQVSDLKFWDSMVTGLYAIQSIPATLIVDPEGLIVARNLRGPELEERLASLLN